MKRYSHGNGQWARSWNCLCAMRHLWEGSLNVGFVTYQPSALSMVDLLSRRQTLLDLVTEASKVRLPQHVFLFNVSVSTLQNCTIGPNMGTLQATTW